MHQEWTSHSKALRKATVQTHGKPFEIVALPPKTLYHRAIGLILRWEMSEDGYIAPWRSNIPRIRIKQSEVYCTRPGLCKTQGGSWDEWRGPSRHQIL